MEALLFEAAATGVTRRWARRLTPALLKQRAAVPRFPMWKPTLALEKLLACGIARTCDMASTVTAALERLTAAGWSRCPSTR
jgi:hypothetical protein